MKVLVIICSHEFSSKNLPYIKGLNDFFINKDILVDYCGISGCNDFHNYEGIITFKYKIINSKFQYSKISDFICSYKEELSDYHWFIKWRPDLRLIGDIDFDSLCEDSINARARVYIGPKKVKYGKSVNGKGAFLGVTDGGYYRDSEKEIVLDDMVYIFSNNLIKQGAFDSVEDMYKNNVMFRSETLKVWESYTGQEHEWFHAAVWKARNIGLNIIGINLENIKWGSFSGDI